MDLLGDGPLGVLTGIGWFAGTVLLGTYVSKDCNSATALSAYLQSSWRRAPEIAKAASFQHLLNILAAHPWPDAVRFQEMLLAAQ
jgi:hypothetical protein